jgi:hypothetical protein
MELDLTLQKGHRLKLFENPSLRDINKNWEKLHNENLHDLYTASYVVIVRN